MINSPLTWMQARRLAGSLARQVDTSPEGQSAFVAAAFERVLCRPPTSDEEATCLEFLATQAERFANRSALAPFAAGPSRRPNRRTIRTSGPERTWSTCC